MCVCVFTAHHENNVRDGPTWLYTIYIHIYIYIYIYMYIRTAISKLGMNFKDDERH